MGSIGEPDTTGNRSSVNSDQETELRLNTLSSLVCELLKTNQELRDALLKAKDNAGRRQESQ